MYSCNNCSILFSINYFAIDAFTIFYWKLKVNYIDFNFELILITEDVKPGHVT